MTSDVINASVSDDIECHHWSGGALAVQRESKVWFISGASRGFGRLWTLAALQRGDRVAAAARDIATLDDLVARFGPAVQPIRLDVTDRAAAVSAVEFASEALGRIDVLVNNAGYGQLGFVEEITEQQARDQFDVNVFGALWLTQAALPIMREQRSGHIIQVSSIGGITSFAGGGMYSASKWALEGFSQALAWEAAPLGIRVTLVEPGSYATGWREATRQATAIEDYGALHDIAVAAIGDKLSTRPDPDAAAEALLALVDAADTPLRVFLGSDALNIVEEDYGHRLAEWRRWQAFAIQAGQSSATATH
jgi:NAD(P)-dependent dehydrogenase (short-subunit alcohol dehydrogenase family)